MNVRFTNGAVQWTCSHCHQVGSPLPLRLGHMQETVREAKLQGEYHYLHDHYTPGPLVLIEGVMHAQ